MLKVIIADTSCLIILTKIGELDLLRQLYKTVTITQDIMLEYGEHLPAWIEAQQAKDHYRQQLLEMQIDKGESIAIALALETSENIIILDDWKARKLAYRCRTICNGNFRSDNKSQEYANFLWDIREKLKIKKMVA